MSENLYLLGHPVAHSKSPTMYRAACGALGLDWEYGLVDCETEADAWEFLAAREWLAANVTMPWKRLAIQAAHDLTPSARAAHGANLLVNCLDGVKGDNTDGLGCTSYLRRAGFAFEGARVAICGTGPTARAIMLACAREGASRVTMLGRDAGRCGKALDGCRDAIWDQLPLEAELCALPYDEAADSLSDAQLIVDATPLGMKPGDPAPFDTSLLHAGQTVFDVVYGHGETRLLAGARAAGCGAHDGSGMLVGQAVENLRIIARLTGAFAVPPDVDLFDVMLSAAFG